MPPEDYFAHVSEDGRRIAVVDVVTTGLSPQRGDRVNVSPRARDEPLQRFSELRDAACSPRVRGMNRYAAEPRSSGLQRPPAMADED